MRIERHLILQHVVLPPAAEWHPPEPDWVVARVSAGVGYWLYNGMVRELKTGDGFVVSGKRNMVVRASQLEILMLNYYLVQTSLLNGLLTVTEGNRLEKIANGLLVPVVFFTATDALGQKLSRLVHQSQPDSLPSRAALVQFWSQAVTCLQTQPLTDQSGHKLLQRFRELTSQMPDAELIKLTMPQLAEMLNCSERHFRRLFFQEFGVSLQARQIELRLQRAKQLLNSTNDKIRSIAFESGYRHLSLFNATFKKRFGHTPSEWRRHNSTNLPPATGAGLAPDSASTNGRTMSDTNSVNPTMTDDNQKNEGAVVVPKANRMTVRLSAKKLSKQVSSNHTSIPTDRFAPQLKTKA